jgi:hypothetical protein
MKSEMTKVYLRSDVLLSPGIFHLSGNGDSWQAAVISVETLQEIVCCRDLTD